MRQETPLVICKSAMIIETINLVSKAQACTEKISASSVQFLDPASQNPRPIVDNQPTLDSVASDQDLSERTIRQLTAIGGEFFNKNANLRLHISGRFIS